MSMIRVEVGSKQVGASLPYRPGNGDGDELVGREAECRTALAAWLAQPGFPPMAPLLVGEPGVVRNPAGNCMTFPRNYWTGNWVFAASRCCRFPPPIP